MRILITGGAGFIGSHIADFLISENHEVIILDNLSSGKIENVNKKALFIKGSITQKRDIEKAIQDVDYVFHLAAMVSVPLSFEKKDLCFKINIQGTKNVLDAALKHKVKKVIFSSSAAVYGDNLNTPLKENEPYSSLSPYAESKIEGEKLCIEYNKKGLVTCSLRYFNVYGTRQDPKSPYSGVISIFIDKAKENNEIIIFGDGSQTRDFIHVNDIVAANVFAMEKLDGVYNVANGKEITIKDLAEKIIKISKSSSKIKYEKERFGDIKKSLADITKIKKQGFTPIVEIDDGLKELLRGWKWAYSKHMIFEEYILKK